jgi:hypothetical protein
LLWCMEADEHGFLPGSLIIRLCQISGQLVGRGVAG